MRRRLDLASTLLGALALVACASPSSEARTAVRPAPADDVAAIEEAARRFSAAYVRGDAEAMAALYTPDAVIFPGNSEAISGRDAIRGYWELAPDNRVTRHRSTPTEIEVVGDVAHDHGVYEVSGERNGEAWGPVRGKYVIVWKRAPSGEWRMHLDIWNGLPARQP